MRIGENMTFDPDLIDDHVVIYYKNMFNGSSSLSYMSLVEYVIPNLITYNVNVVFTMVPTLKEIKGVFFSLNRDGSIGPDGFGAFFFQLYWEVIQEDMVRSTTEFFVSIWVMKNYNVNTLILIPKSQDADSIEYYRPIPKL